MITIVLSSLNASMIVCGTRIPNLIFFFITSDSVPLRADIIPTSFLSIWVTQKLKAGSWLIPCESDYSATWMEWYYLRSDSLSYVVVPSFHLTHKCQPFVVLSFEIRLRTTTSWSATNKACPYILWSNIDSNKSYCCTSSSNWAYIFSVMIFSE